MLQQIPHLHAKLTIKQSIVVKLNQIPTGGVGVALKNISDWRTGATLNGHHHLMAGHNN